MDGCDVDAALLIREPVPSARAGHIAVRCVRRHRIAARSIARLRVQG